MFSLQRSILSTVVAWFVATAFIVIYSFLVTEPSEWPSSGLGGVIREIGLLGYYVAMLVFPTCLLLVTPLLRLLPASSKLWNPRVACMVAMCVAPFGIYAWAVMYRRQFFMPELHDRVHVMIGLAAICAGVGFAYTYATGLTRAEKAAPQRKP